MYIKLNIVIILYIDKLFDTNLVNSGNEKYVYIHSKPYIPLLLLYPKAFKRPIICKLNVFPNIALRPNTTEQSPSISFGYLFKRAGCDTFKPNGA